MSSVEATRFRSNPVFWLFLVAVLVGAWWLVHSLGKGRQALMALLHIPLPDVLAIILLALLYFFIQGSVFNFIYRILKIHRPLNYGVLMFLASNFVNTVAPVVGLSGFAYIVYIESKRGISQPRAILLTILFYLIDYGAFLFLLLIAISYLAITSSLPRPILIGTIIFGGLIALLASVMVLFFTHPTLLRKVLGRIRKVGTVQAKEFGDQATIAFQEVRHSHRLIFYAVALAFINHFVAILLLGVAFGAAGLTPTLPLLLAGYSIGTLLAIVSITPAGLGVAEGGMVAAFAGLGVSIESAVLVSLLYRFGIVIVPLLLGLPALHRIQDQASSSALLPL